MEGSSSSRMHYPSSDTIRLNQARSKSSLMLNAIFSLRITKALGLAQNWSRDSVPRL
jgi:hypothetical protein